MKRWMSVSVGICAAVGLVAACNGKASSTHEDVGGGEPNWETDASTGAVTTGSGFSPPDTSVVFLAADPPPALSGGTMLLASDGVTAVAADPDRDAVWW